MAKLGVDGTPDTESAKAMKRALESGENNKGVQRGAWTTLAPDFYVYLFTVAKREFTASHALLGTVQIPACENGERYKRFHMPIPEPFPQKVEDVFNIGRDPFDYHRGNAGAKRIAQDICDPSNPTLNQTIDDYGQRDRFFAVQDGTNLAKHGVFWSLNPVPTEEEIALAEKRRDNFYRTLIAEHDKMYASNPNTASSFGREIRIALDHFGEERPYHKKFIAMRACPNCAQQIPQGVAYHRDQDGDLCIIDWKRTVESGKRKREDVPVDLIWWDEKPATKAGK